ncbi:hypothetical protein K470DRAFT_260125 [Piedraia hortae CBS 480.64]|uniref:Uncharacterized protein n=1 Tax=Piedraia hortae CBS 480.64 TaxID=1314780 RepID=A0A6A7BSL1_9PEZI|nr:hypothetical protein K470DRAFT_260125 [Piedraia hortae CBS 480.64]
MRFQTIVAAASLASVTLATPVGRAKVVNACSYPVHLCNVPAENGGYEQSKTVLQPNGTFSQVWTQLSNDQGWSIKLSKDETLSHIMQYEYTFHNDGIIWYDLSDVDGNPWDGNWELTAISRSSPCNPKQQAYRYSTDDAYGMQACSQDAVITVTLCSGDSKNDGAAASASSSLMAASSSATQNPSYTSSFSTPTSLMPTPTQSASENNGHDGYSGQGSQSNSGSDQSTLATVTTTATADDGAVVTEVATTVVTDVVTATAYAPHRRDVHRHRRGGHA